MVWCVVTWCGVVWCGVVWCGVVVGWGGWGGAQLRRHVTETNKTHARVHTLDPGLLDLLFAQDTLHFVAPGAAYAWGPGQQGATFSTPPLPDPSHYGGPGAWASVCPWRVRMRSIVMARCIARGVRGRRELVPHLPIPNPPAAHTSTHVCTRARTCAQALA